MPDLKRYRQKRDPGRTPEPFGDDAGHRPVAPDAPRAFVVQQHAARRLHWDLRLEIDGVLVSWAVPRGPSLDPDERRLAVRTEDHPLEYADFEGVIPEGNYGAGAMIVWDAGTYRIADGLSPDEGLERGKLDLWLRGAKLQGRFALVRTKGEDGRSWLLLHKRRGAASAESPEPVETQPASVFSGLTVEEISAGVTRDAELEAGLASLDTPELAVDPESLRPMLATSVDAPFSREGWLFELKYDGVRALASRTPEGGVRIRMRSGRDATALYPELLPALSRLPAERFVIDGEICVVDDQGRSSFEGIQRRFTQTDVRQAARLAVEAPVTFQVFDLPSVLGRDLRGVPLVRRKELLALFAPRLGRVSFSDHIEGDGEALFEAAGRNGLEGVVAKRADSRYEAGRRAKSWLKLKVPRSALLCVVGWLPGKGSRAALGSLMLAWQRDGEFVYAGNVGSGLDDETLSRLARELPELELERAAFVGEPDPPTRGTRYVRPERVVEVRFSEVTSSGALRHPVFVALRDELPTSACVAPEERDGEALADQASAAAPTALAPKLELTRLDKVFWPVEGYTKGDLLAYYDAAWPWLKPYLRDRPVVLTRYPDGIEGKHFYQKNAPDFTPDWVRREQIEGSDHFVCNDKRTLLYVINSGAIPLHVFSARLGRLERPDWLILDLDPKEAPFRQVVSIARHLHRLLSELDVAHFVKTSGQAGLHVMLPLGARLEHAEARALAEVLARCVCADLPEIATIARPLAARAKKVYVDFLQNGSGKLIASPLSVRPRPGATISMPLTWGQVTSRLDPARWTIRSALTRLERHGDPFREVLGPGIDLRSLLDALSQRLAAARAGKAEQR